LETVYLPFPLPSFSSSSFSGEMTAGPGWFRILNGWRTATGLSSLRSWRWRTEPNEAADTRLNKVVSTEKDWHIRALYTHIRTYISGAVLAV